MIIKLLSYNIRFGGVGREALLAEVIKAIAPDVVVFQEATAPRVIEELSIATELPFWAARQGHSIGFMSSLEIGHYEWHRPHAAKHSYLEIVPAGSNMHIFGLHLSAMFSKWSEQRRANEIRALLKSIEKHREGFHVLTGDFNSLAPGALLDSRRMPFWIRSLIFLSGRDIRRDTITIMLDGNYLDGYRLLNPERPGYTFPTWDPHLRLDYAFIPVSFSTRLVTCDVITQPAAASLASDHFPLLIQLETGPV